VECRGSVSAGRTCAIFCPHQEDWGNPEGIDPAGNKYGEMIGNSREKFCWTGGTVTAREKCAMRSMIHRSIFPIQVGSIPLEKMQESIKNSQEKNLRKILRKNS
jgi:hypothetical protein